MYRVNAERSQEKNDQNGCTQQRTKVTCATCTRRKSSADTTTHSRVFCHRVVSAARTSSESFATKPGVIAASRTSAKLCAIYNEIRFCNDALLKERVKERNHG